MATKKKSTVKKTTKAKTTKSKAKVKVKEPVKSVVVESVPDTPKVESKALKTNPIVARNKAIREFPKQVGYWAKLQRKFGLTKNQVRNVLRGRDA